MICTVCQHENESDASFCSNGGRTLTITCPNCSASATSGSKFGEYVNKPDIMRIESEALAPYTSDTGAADVPGLIHIATASKPA